MGAQSGSTIYLTGSEQTAKALGAFFPDLRKMLNKTIRAALTTVKNDALGRYAKGVYTVSISNKAALGSVGVPGGGTRAATWEDSSPNIPAAIFEFMGKNNAGNTAQARATIDSLNRRYGRPGRFLWAAWDDHSKEVLGTIREDVAKQEKIMQERLSAAGEGF